MLSSGRYQWMYWLLGALCVLRGTSGLVPNLYCGLKNCYDVLGVTRDADKGEISKAYRRLAVKYHPDRYKGPDAEHLFIDIATAYETLKSEEERSNYDYMLDHPEEYYYHYYKYYRHRADVDVRLVVLAVVAIVSVIQYIGWHHSYSAAISYALQQARFRSKAKDVAKETGVFPDEKKLRKSGMNKEEIKTEEERVLRSVIEQNINIMGGHRKHHLWDVLAFQMFLWPYYCVRYAAWYVGWVWKYNIMKGCYGDEEKTYLTRKHAGLTLNQWELLGETQQEELVARELWVDGNRLVYQKEKEEENREKMAQSTRHKQYRRYMKAHGPSRMTFED